MELALTIVAGLGFLAFLIGYLSFIIAGFRHHFITGVIASLPVLNIVAVPALWEKTSKKLLLSLLGIILIAGSWFLGADNNIKRILFNSNNKKTQTTFATPANKTQSALSASSNVSKQVVGTTVIRPSNDNTTIIEPFENEQLFGVTVDESNMQTLPPKALYKLTFEEIPIKNTSSLKGRIIKIKTDKNEVFEGRVTKASKSSVFIQSDDTISIVNEFPVANIKHLFLMVKKANKK